MNKIKSFLISLLLIGNIAFGIETIEKYIDRDFDSRDMDCHCHESALKLKHLCAKKACIKCLKAMQASVQDLVADNFCTSLVVGQSVCADNLNINQSACIPTLTSSDIQTQDLCVTGSLRAANGICGQFRAMANFSVDTVYTLDDPLPFDTIVDDPNGNLSFSPFLIYTAPVSGYYLVNLHVHQHGLVTSAGPILGTPIAHTGIFVNGVEIREILSPMLTFSDEQQVEITAILILNVGDTVYTHYGMSQVSSTSGLTEVPGTVIIESAPKGGTIFSIHLLSSTCTPTTCTPRTCAPCNSTCTPIPCSCEPEPQP